MNLNSDFLRCLNLARQNPKYYVSLLETQLASFVNSMEIPLNGEIMYQANQGKSAWIEAKHFLLKQTPVPPLIKHDGLCKAAYDHQIDVCKNKIFDHNGSDGSSFSQRILRYCKKVPGAMAEMIGIDFDLKDRKTDELTILSLIIDDGIQDRGHRNTIFNPSYKFVGWSSGKQDQKIVTVFTLLENSLNQQNRKRDEEKLKQNINFMNFSKKRKVLGTDEQIDGDRIKGIPFKDKKNIIKASELPKNSIDSQTPSKITKRISQKQENSRIFYEEGAKIVETTSKIIYKDGSIQESVSKNFFYQDTD